MALCRTSLTPLSCCGSVLPPWDSSFPPTPTPTSALRPSLSLHNLATKNFTEVTTVSTQNCPVYYCTCVLPYS